MAVCISVSKKNGIRYSLSAFSVKGQQLPFIRPAGSFPPQTPCGPCLVALGQEEPKTRVTVVGGSQAEHLGSFMAGLVENLPEGLSPDADHPGYAFWSLWC